MITPRLLVINLFIATALAGTHLYAFHFVLMLIKDKFNASPTAPASSPPPDKCKDLKQVECEKQTKLSCSWDNGKCTWIDKRVCKANVRGLDFQFFARKRLHIHVTASPSLGIVMTGVDSISRRRIQWHRKMGVKESANSDRRCDGAGCRGWNF